MTKSQSTRWNKKEVTIPWFVVGTPEIDLKATIEAVQAAVQVNKTAAE